MGILFTGRAKVLGAPMVYLRQMASYNAPAVQLRANPL